MADNTPTTLTCPSCGAPLEVDGKSALVRCKFCKNTAFVPGVAATQTPDPHQALEEIIRLARSGDLIEAIRQYRELYGVGLKEAKDAVEALAAGKVASERQTFPRAAPLEDTSRLLEEVKELVRQGNKIEAIKRYRVAKDTSLTEAKDVIDQIEAALTGIPVPPRPVIAGTPSTYTQPAKKSRLGCVLTGIIVAAVGGVLAFLLFQPGGPFSDSLVANGPALLVPSGSGAPDIVSAFYNATDDTRLIGFVDADKGKLVWQAEAYSSAHYFNALARDGEKVYAADDTDLLAYQMSDGSLAWRTSMPDRVNYSDSVLLAVDGRVIAFGADQIIRAYDAASGEFVWERVVDSYDRTLRLIEGSLMVVDYVGDSYDFGLFFLDPQTGAEQRVLSPACAYSDYNSITPEPDSPLLYEASTGSIYFISSDYSGCVQRFDIATGQPLWEYRPENSFSFSPFGIRTLETETTIFFNTNDQLLAVDKATGSVQTLLTDENNEFLPLAVSGDTLIVRVRRTRGTEKFILMGVNASTGAQLWQMDMDNAKPVDPPDEMSGLVDEDESGWTWHLLADQLVLVKFQANPHQLVLQTVDPANGTVASEVTVALKSVIGDFYSVPDILGWDGPRIYFSLDGKFYSVDVTTGEILFKFQ